MSEQGNELGAKSKEVTDFETTQQKKGRYTYTRTQYTSYIPAKNCHFWSYTETYTAYQKSRIPTHIPIEFQTLLIYRFLIFLSCLIRQVKSFLVNFVKQSQFH